ncbi:hypothetical protein BW41_03141 [Sphingomonas sp. RIT328]|nr:hypothetical protein BW41_03141 [Sphingomonas sp. RIT328]
MIGMPARQRGAIGEEVARRPGDAPGVLLRRRLIVRAEDVEIAVREPLEHQRDDLLARPCAGGLLGPRRGHAGIGEAGDQQMRADPIPGAGAQAVRQPLGQRLHPGLADIVGGIARRLGDPLFRSGGDDQPGRVARDHRRRERLHGVEHAHQIDVDDAAPDVAVGEDVAAIADAGIGHQHRDRPDPRGERVHRRGVGDVDAIGARSGDRRGGRVERVARPVEQRDPHALCGEGARRGEADAARRAGDDRLPIRRDGCEGGDAHRLTLAIVAAG